MSTYQPAPEGEHEAEIIAATLGEVPRLASEDNVRGEALRLRVSVGREWGYLFADVPLDWGAMLRAIRGAVGLDADKLRAEAFVGRRARVVVGRYTGRDGAERACIRRWLPIDEGQAAPTAKPTRTRRQPDTDKPSGKVSRNAPPRHGDPDDLPF
jgi:hypothetical protein